MAGWLPVVVLHLRAHLLALLQLREVERVQNCFALRVYHTGQNLLPIVVKL